MKVFLLALITFLGIVRLNAQTGTSVIQLQPGIFSMGEIVREIERQCGYVVISNGFDLSRRFSVHRSSGTVDQIVEGLLSGSGWRYRIEERYIVFVDLTASGASLQSSSLQSSASRQPSSAQPSMTATPAMTATPSMNTSVQSFVRDEVFTYPSMSLVPKLTGREVDNPLAGNDTSPFLGIKVNLLYGATLTPNISGEVGLGRKTTIEIGGGINKWNQNGSFEDNSKFVHWVIKPEFRYWLCERFNGHFFGVHAFYSQYNIGGYDVPSLFEKEYRYEGDVIGVGLSYGYHWIWNKRWGMEFNFGFGAALLKYDKSDCEKCSPLLSKHEKTYIGPTSAGIKLVYMIK